jgi:oligopeptide transport system permease protein
MSNNYSDGGATTNGSEHELRHFVAPIDATPVAAVDTVNIPSRRSNLWIDAWRDLRGRWLFWVSAAMFLFVVIVALFPGMFTQVPPNDGCFLSNSNGAPEPGHILGFNKQGCDIFSRIVHGTSTSLSVGVIVITITSILGLLFGAVAGFYGGWVDAFLSRIGEVFFSIPYILAAVVIMSVLAQYRSIWTISLAIGVFAWPVTARVLRAEILRVKTSDYVMASTALGLSRFKILLRHVLPNSIAPVIVISTIALAGAIVAEASLSFLGVGLGGNIMSWGNDINQAQQDLRVAPQNLIYPSIALSFTVFAIISLGELVRDALDPKARALR